MGGRPCLAFLSHERALSTKDLLEQLARQHYDRLCRAAVFMCGSVDAAQDLVQETFLAAATALDSFEGRSSSYTWLYGIMLNKLRRWLRNKDKVHSLHEPVWGSDGAAALELLEADQPAVDEEVARREEARMVREALDQLPPHHRSVLVLRYLESMSYEEIAETLSCSLGTVKSRVHYALRKVADRLEAPLSDGQ